MIPNTFDVYLYEKGWTSLEEVYAMFVDRIPVDLLVRRLDGSIALERLTYAQRRFTEPGEDFYTTNTGSFSFSSMGGLSLPHLNVDGHLCVGLVEDVSKLVQGSFIPAAGLKPGDASQMAFTFTEHSWRISHTGLPVIKLVVEQPSWILVGLKGLPGRTQDEVRAPGVWVNLNIGG